MSTAQNVQSAPLHTVTIRAAERPWSLPWNEFWRHRELLYFLTWRDIKIRYAQTALGVMWVILQPLAIALALVAFLGRVVHVQSGSLPYAVFAYAGMVLWQLFAQGLTQASNSIISSEQLISKVYFPRIFIPLSALLASLLDFFIRLVPLSLFFVYYRIAPSAQALLLPLFVVPALFASLGAGLWLATLNVKYRDVRNMLTFLVQFWFFATPIAYPTTAIPARWRLLYAVNPMVGATDGFRWALHGQGAFPAQSVTVAVLVSCVLLITGIYYFRRTEDTFADFI